MGYLGLAALAAAGVAAGAMAQDISFTPEDGPGVLSEAFEHVLPGGIHSTEYVPFGVDFSGFSIGAYAGTDAGWSFVDADGILSLNEYVGGRIVMRETGKPGVTDLVWVDADLVNDPDAVQLACWDSMGKFLGSAIADGGVGPDGDLIAKFEHPGIASFMLLENGGHGGDEANFGVRRIYLNTPVPAPGTGWLLSVGLSAAGRARRGAKKARGNASFVLTARERPGTLHRIAGSGAAARAGREKTGQFIHVLRRPWHLCLGLWSRS